MNVKKKTILEKEAIVNKGYIREDISDNAVIISMLILEIISTMSSSNDAMNTSVFRIKIHAA